MSSLGSTEDFKMTSMYFCYFDCNHFPSQVGMVLHFNKLEPSSPEDALCQASLIEICPIVLEKKIKV